MNWTRTLTTTAAVLALIATPASVRGQDASSEEDQWARAVFAPELLMQHRRAIGLTDEQRDAASRLIQDLQGRVVSLQWELLDEMESLTESLDDPRVDLDRAMDRFNEVLQRENEIKRLHLELLVRLKNLLTPEQQTLLTRLRDEGTGAG
jgi:Spy/CpxP family protein refolding chaperone